MAIEQRMSFVGRVQEQRQFLIALQGLLAHHRRWSELIQAHGPAFDPELAPEDNSYASIFLPHGIGGIGKSWLTRRCLDLASEMPHAPSILTIYDDVSLGAPVLEPVHLLDRLHDQLVRAGYSAQGAAYRRAKADTPAIVDRVARYQFENREQWVKMLQTAANLAARREPEPGYRSFAAVSIAYIHAGGAETAGKDAATLVEAYDLLLEQMQAAGKIEPEEVALFRNPPAAQAARLVAGLMQVAQERPLVIGLDNLEIIVSLEPLIRDCLVLPTNNAPIIWILSGRYNLADERIVEIAGEPRTFKGYRDLLGENPPIVWDMSIFGDADLRDYLIAETERRRAALLIDDELIEAVKATSSGVPLVVEMVSDALFTMDRDEFLRDFALDEKGLLPGDRLDKITERFLRYCLTHGEDLERVQAMALLRKGADERALSAVWNLAPGRAARDILRILRSRYAFVMPEGLHDAVYEFVRRQLHSTWRDSVSRERLSRRAVRHYRAEWDSLQQNFDDTTLRVRDSRWQRATRDLLNALLWHDPDEAILFLLPRFVEGLGFDRPFANGLLTQAEEFLAEGGAGFSGKYANLLHRMRIGMQDIDWFFEEPGEAIGAMLETLLDAPGLAPLHLSILQLWQGNWLVENGSYEEGLAAYLAADQNRPDDAAGLAQQLGRAFYELSSRFLWPRSALETVPSEPGLQAAQRAVELDPDNGAAWFNLGVALDYLGREEESISAYERAIKIEPRSIYYNNLGNVYSALGQDEQAIEAYNQAVALDPAYAWPYHSLGQIYADRAEYELALDSYRQALDRHQSDRDRAISWDEFGDVHAVLGNYDEAISAYRWASVLNSQLASPWYGLGNVYRLLEQQQEAIEAYQRAILLNPNHAGAHHRLGQIYAGQGNHDRAMSFYQQAIEQYEDDRAEAEAWTDLGDVHTALARYPEALEAYRRAVKLDPDQANAWNNIGDVYTTLGDRDAALKAYRQAVQINPDYSQAWDSLAGIYTHLEQYDQAIDAYRRVTALEPDDARPYDNLGFIYRQRGEYEQALTCYRQAVERHRDDAGRAASWSNLGDLQVILGNQEQAIKAYQWATTLDPDYAWPHHNLGTLYEAQGEHELAIGLYRQAIERHLTDQGRAVSWHHLADLYRSLDRPEEAIPAYRQVIALGAPEAETWNSLGDAYLALDRTEEAARAYRQAIALDAAGARPYYSLGLISTRNGDHEAALTFYRQAIERQADDRARAVAWSKLGDTHLALADPDEADRAYRQAIELGPDYAPPYYSLAAIQARRGQHEPALTLYQQAITRYPAEQTDALALAWNGLGDVYQALEQPEEAIEAYRQAGQLDPTLPTPWSSLGDVYRTLDRTDQAIESYQRAVELDPANPQNYHHLGLVYEKLGEHDLAVVRYRQALESYSPEQHLAAAVSWNHLGNSRAALEQYDQATEAYRQAIQLDEQYAAPWNSLGNIYARQSQPQDAIRAYQRAIDLDAGLTSPWRGLGDIYRGLEQDQEAIAAYKRAIELDPDDAWSYYSLGLIDEKRGNHDQALEYYQQAIARYPQDQPQKLALAWNGSGNIYRIQTQDQEAIAAYRQAISLDPDYVQPYHSLGDIYRKLGQYEPAVDAYQQALKRYSPEQTQPQAIAWNSLGNAYGRLRRWTDAIEAYRQATGLDPAYGLPWYHLGNVYHRLRQYEEAEEAYRRSLELDPAPAWPYNNLGLVYERTERPKLALEFYQQAIERHRRDPDKAITWNNMGNVHYTQEQYEEAAKAYRQAIALDPRYARPWNSLADVYQAQGREQGVVEAYQRAISLEPAFAWPYHNLGDFYLKKGAYTQALNYYRQAIERHPAGRPRDQAVSWNGLGNVYRALDQYDKAIEAYQRAIQLNPDDAWPRHNLAFVYKNLGNYQQAEALYRQAIERFAADQHKAISWNNLGNVYAALGRSEAAIEAYKQAIDLDSTYALPWNSLGETFSKLGRDEESLEAFQQAIKRDSRYILAWSNLGDIYRRLEQTDETIRAYEQAISLDPTYVWPYHYLGLVYEERADYETAVRYYQQAIDRHHDPEHKAILWDRIGNIYRITGKAEPAIDAFRQATGYDPRYSAPWYSLGNIYAALEQDEDAIHAYRRAIELNPADAWPYHNLALVYERRELYGEAIALYRQAIDRHDTDHNKAISWDSLGNVFSDLGRYEEAIQAFRQAIQFNRNYALPWNSLGDIYHTLGDYQQAVEAYRRAIELDPDYAWPYNNLGLVYEEMQEYELAISTYRAVINRHTNKRDQAISWNSLGDVYGALRRENEAIAAYEQAILLDPDYIWPYNSLGALYEKRGDQDQAYALYQQATRRHRQRTMA